MWCVCVCVCVCVYVSTVIRTPLLRSSESFPTNAYPHICMHIHKQHAPLIQSPQTVGTAVGFSVGVDVGASEGLSVVGSMVVGTSVGLNVGSAVGSCVLLRCACYILYVTVLCM